MDANKYDVLAQLPQRIGLEASKYCQLRCAKCPTGLGMNTGEKGFLTSGNFHKFLDEIPGFKGAITFSNWGEPFLNPEIFDIIYLATEREIRSTVSSNLCHDKVDFAKKVVGSGLCKITVGIDGANAETYSMYRRGGDWGIVMHNIDEINREKVKQGKNTPEIVWQMILTKYNEHEVETARSMSQEKGMIFKVKPLRQENVMEVSKEDWSPSESSFNKYFNEFEDKHRKTGGIIRCAELWTRPSIDWNGDVYPCCIIDEKRFRLGNIYEEGFLKVWNAEKYIESRKLLLDIKYVSRLELACRDCKYRFEYSSKTAVHPNGVNYV